MSLPFLFFNSYPQDSPTTIYGTSPKQKIADRSYRLDALQKVSGIGSVSVGNVYFYNIRFIPAVLSTGASD